MGHEWDTNGTRMGHEWDTNGLDTSSAIYEPSIQEPAGRRRWLLIDCLDS